MPTTVLHGPQSGHRPCEQASTEAAWQEPQHRHSLLQGQSSRHRTSRTDSHLVQIEAQMSRLSVLALAQYNATAATLCSTQVNTVLHKVRTYLHAHACSIDTDLYPRTANLCCTAQNTCEGRIPNTQPAVDITAALSHAYAHATLPQHFGQMYGSIQDINVQQNHGSKWCMAHKTIRHATIQAYGTAHDKRLREGGSSFVYEPEGSSSSDTSKRCAALACAETPRPQPNRAW